MCLPEDFGIWYESPHLWTGRIDSRGLNSWCNTSIRNEVGPGPGQGGRYPSCLAKHCAAWRARVSLSQLANSASLTEKIGPGASERASAAGSIRLLPLPACTRAQQCLPLQSCNESSFDFKGSHRPRPPARPADTLLIGRILLGLFLFISRPSLDRPTPTQRLSFVTGRAFLKDGLIFCIVGFQNRKILCLRVINFF